MISREEKNNKSTQKAMQRQTWNTTNQMIIKSRHSQKQTSQLFRAVSSSYQSDFLSSTKRIIQLGISTGDFLQEIASDNSTRKIIGYDISSTAIDYITSKGLQGRLVDLNEINTTKKCLAYQSALENDLSLSADILAVRILEYLDPGALILLLFALINLSKPNTMFYFDIFSAKFDDLTQFQFTNNYQYLKENYVASFFAPRTDMQFVYHTINKNEENDKCNQCDTTTERLILKKI